MLAPTFTAIPSNKQSSALKCDPKECYSHLLPISNKLTLLFLLLS